LKIDEFRMNLYSFVHSSVFFNKILNQRKESIKLIKHFNIKFKLKNSKIKFIQISKTIANAMN
jgi:hypothetical protein